MYGAIVKPKDLSRQLGLYAIMVRRRNLILTCYIGIGKKFDNKKLIEDISHPCWIIYITPTCCCQTIFMKLKENSCLIIAVVTTMTIVQFLLLSTVWLWCSRWHNLRLIEVWSFYRYNIPKFRFTTMLLSNNIFSIDSLYIDLIILFSAGYFGTLV